jgi:hypothetical protein
MTIGEDLEKKRQTEATIIKKANDICKSDFMQYPDYDADEPITDLPSALTIILTHDSDDETPSDEVYDFLVFALQPYMSLADFNK